MSFVFQMRLKYFSGLIFLVFACGGEAGGPASNGGQESKTPQKAEITIRKGEFSMGDRTFPTLETGGLTWLGANLDLALPDSWCYDNQNSCSEQGRLYRWPDARKACAALGEGWRLPSEMEWRQLAGTLGGYADWLSEQNHGDPVAANKALIEGGGSGFDLPLSGWRGSNGGFDSAGQMGFYWTATETTEDEAWFYIVLPAGGKLTRRSTNQQMGMACRCVRSMAE